MLDLLALCAFLLLALGACRLHRAYRANRARRIDAAYRAAALLINIRRALRAGQYRAASREWGRVA